MTTRVPPSTHMSQSGLNLLRFVLASYFIGISLGLINGTNVTALTAEFMPKNIAVFVSNTSVFLMAYFVLMGIWIRPAALLLSGFVLATNAYLAWTLGTSAVMNDFWRDAALISGLMMTYMSVAPGTRGRPALVRRKPAARKVSTETTIQPRRIKSDLPTNRTARPEQPLMEPIREGADIVNIFAA